MDIKTLESFKLSDAVKFHDDLNPRLWLGNRLDPAVKKQLLVIAEDFVEELGIGPLDIEDITVSGSNAAYSYTPHSDLDLHILVDMSKLPSDEVYRELFQAKKNLYNDSHDISVHGVPVELYVQDTNEPVVSLGEYSLLKNKWIKLPTKRRANLDQNATKAKFERLKELIEVALKSKNIDKVTKVLATIKRYRKAGLDKGGEFSPENLAFKVARKQGWIQKLYDLRDKLHSEELTIENMYIVRESKKLDKPTLSVGELAEKHGVSRMDIATQLDKGIKVELEHTSDRSVAREIALDHLAEDPKYYDKLAKVELEEAKVPSVRQQIINDVKKNGGSLDEYFVRFTDTDKLGFSAKQGFGQTLDVDDPEFDVDYIGHGKGRRALWFYPLSYYLKEKNDLYASNQPYAWLVKLKPDAWLQTVKRGDTKIEQAPQGKERAGMLRMSNPPAAVFFEHGFDVVGRYYDYANQHQRHGEVKGKPEPSFFDKVRGLDEGASGYIPSNAEKNDPRFKTALTVDIKPNTMKKDAAKFGNKISRAGIPPQARADGKIT